MRQRNKDREAFWQQAWDKRNCLGEPRAIENLILTKAHRLRLGHETAQ